MELLWCVFCCIFIYEVSTNTVVPSIGVSSIINWQVTFQDTITVYKLNQMKKMEAQNSVFVSYAYGKFEREVAWIHSGEILGSSRCNEELVILNSTFRPSLKSSRNIIPAIAWCVKIQLDGMPYSGTNRQI